MPRAQTSWIHGWMRKGKTMTEKEAIRELATVQADIIRRMGGSFGSPEDWHRAYTVSVKVMESMHKQIVENESPEAQ